MGLEVLYGPVDIQVGGTPVVGAAGFTWIRGLGLLMTLNPGAAFGFYAVQLDGSVQGPRSSYSGSGSAPVLDLRSSRGMAVKSLDSLYKFDYLAGRPDLTPFLTAAGIIAGSTDIDVITTDGRYLRFSSGTPMQVLSSVDGNTFTAEYTFAAPAGYSFVNVSRGRSTTEVCITYTNGSLGQLRFYDTATKAQAGETRYIGEPFDSVWYVPKFDIFVEVKSLQLKILADAVAPDSLSDPAASPSIAAGLTSQVTVQLLGAQSEPCVGELVNWSISSGSGSLVLPQSVTDETGTATNTYVCPVGSSGGVVIDAQLNY